MLGNLISCFLGLLFLWQVVCIRKQILLFKYARNNNLTVYKSDLALNLAKANPILALFMTSKVYKFYMLTPVQRIVLFFRVIFIIAIVGSFIFLMWFLTTKYGEFLR